MQPLTEHNRNGSVGLWAWILPATFLAHMAEEAFGGDGLLEWMTAGGGVDLSMAEFISLTLAGTGMLCLAVWAARKWKAWRWSLVSGATIFAANGIWHAAICLMTRSYIPGLWTGLFLYIPAGCILLYRLRHLMSPRLFTFAVAVGMIIHGVTLWLVLRLPGFHMG